MLRKSSSRPSKTKLDRYYKGKTVAIAGGAGMVGVQLTRLMSDLVGNDGMVIVLDNFSRGNNIVYSPNVFYVTSSAPGSYVPWILTPSNHIRQAFVYIGIDVGYNNYDYMLPGVDVFFNLAAVVAGVLHNQSNHLQMYDDNVRLLTGPLRACERAGVPVFFQTSSVCVYAEDHQSPCVEVRGWGGDPNPANAGYAEAKRDGERAAKFADIDKVVIGRPSNIIGPYDYYDETAHVIPAFIDRALNTDGVFRIYGNALAEREFIYSWDVAVGMAYVAAFGARREAYNIGTGGKNTRTMQALADMVVDMVGRLCKGRPLSREYLVDNSAGGGDLIRYSWSSKLEALGWKHTIPLELALLYTIAQHLQYRDWTEPNYWSPLSMLDNIEEMMSELDIPPHAANSFPGLDTIIKSPPYEQPGKPIETVDA